MSYVMQIHIGPVQSFIAAARRSRDLWFGSWLLSELSKAAARAVAEIEPAGVDALVFPAPKEPADLEPNSSLNVANEIVAVIAGEPKDVAKAAREAVDARLDNICTDAFSVDLRRRLQTWEIAEKQIKDFVEFYWAATPIVNDDYGSARAISARLLAGRKNTRDFKPVDWGSNRPKSLLDGARESVIPKDDVKNVERMYQFYRARRGEELSGVDLLKRLGKVGNESYFPSTSHMAAMPLRKQLEKSAHALDAWASYLSKLPDKVERQERVYHDLRLPVLDDHDGALLFTSRLVDYLEGPALRQAEKALKEFFNGAGIEEPNPYYAILVGDGDSMGQTISGLKTPQDNRAFSQALAAFAGVARDIIKKYDGAVVYVGGDDALALLPLHTAVPCAAELAETFRNHLKSYGTADAPPTFSTGIAIVHHLEPLEDALELARKAERTAKAVDGKNALAVTLDKRSGVPRTVVGKWGALDVRLLNLAALHQSGVIPDRLAYQLLDAYHLLGGKEALKSNETLRLILGLEAKRIIERKRVEGGQQVVNDKHKEYVRSVVNVPDVTIATAADELVIAALLAKVREIAGETPIFQEQEVVNQ